MMEERPVVVVFNLKVPLFGTFRLILKVPVQGFHFFSLPPEIFRTRKIQNFYCTKCWILLISVDFLSARYTHPVFNIFQVPLFGIFCLIFKVPVFKVKVVYKIFPATNRTLECISTTKT